MAKKSSNCDIGQSGNIKIDPFLLVLNEKGEFMNTLNALNENFPHWSVNVWTRDHHN